jgi:transcriptional regulator
VAGLAGNHRQVGILAVNNLDPALAPLMLPPHFTVGGDELLMHLARPNPVWPHLEAAGRRGDLE